MTKLEVAVRIEAAPEHVWAVVSDHERMAEWGWPIQRARLGKEGSPDRNGIGAVRLLQAPGQEIREEIVAWDPPRSFDYVLTRGAPVKDHHGKLTVIPEPRGCEVRWAVEFQPIVPLTGPALALGLRLAFKRMLRSLKRLCESNRGP